MVGESDVRWVPVRTAGKVLGVSRQRVYQLIGSGGLVGRKVDGTWLVSIKSASARQLSLPGVGKDAA